MGNALARKTNFARVLGQTEKVAEYDAAAKKLLANTIVLAHILQGCVEEFVTCSIEEIIDCIDGVPEISKVGVHRDETNVDLDAADRQLENPSVEDGSETEGKVTYDIRFQVFRPNHPVSENIRLIINVESQNDFYPGYPLEKRGIYYGSRMISSQYGSVFFHAEYDKIEKVYSIWICTNPPDRVKNSITRYYIEAEPLVGDYVAKKEDYDLLSVVMIYLDRNCDEIEDGLLGFLDVLFSSGRSLDEKRDILENQYGVPMTEEMEAEVQDMGSVGIGLLEEGYERGIVEGEERGIQRGIERGLVQGEEREESRFARLTEILMQQNRTNDVLRAATERTFKFSLYQEFHIE